MALSDIKIRNSKPKGKPFKLFDEGAYFFTSPRQGVGYGV